MGDSRSYRQSGYDRYDDSASRHDGYERDAPYDTLYRRSFDAVPNDARSTRSGNDSRPERHHHHRDSYYDDDAAFYYEKQRQVGRPRDEYEDPYGARVDGGYHDNGGRSQRSRRSHRHRDEDDESEAKKRLSGLCGKETKDVAATVVGALGGAFVGHEASHGKGFGTLGGAVLGGLSANAIEHSHLKREEVREEQAREKRHDEY